MNHLEKILYSKQLWGKMVILDRSNSPRKWPIWKCGRISVLFVFLKWFLVKQVTLICLIEFKYKSLIEITGNLHLTTKIELVIKKHGFFQYFNQFKNHLFKLNNIDFFIT